MHSKTTKYLVPLLSNAINGTINSFEINHLVKIAHRFASIRLTQLIKSHKIHFEIYPHTITSIALDCIAELFQRDEDGNYFELITYFSDNEGLNKLTDSEIVQKFQALVFSKLNDGIVRLYRDHDPILSKILRNLKSAIKNRCNLFMFDRFGEIYFSPCPPEERNSHLGEFQYEEMEAELANVVHGAKTIGQYLETAVNVLQNTAEFRKFMRVIDLAIIIKSVAVRYDLARISASQIENDMVQHDIAKIVETSLADLRNSFNDMYIKSNKMKTECVNQYLSAITEMLNDTFVRNNGNGFSYYDYLLESMPEITYEEYRTKHRIRFEYMVKVAKKHTINKIKEIVE